MEVPDRLLSLRRAVEYGKADGKANLIVNLDLLDLLLRGELPVGGNELPPEEVTKRLYEIKADRELLAWNLAGCLTIAESRKPSEFNQEMALPALHAVNRLVAELANDDEPVDPDFLLKAGFAGGNDEPDTDVYDLSAGNAGLCIRVVLRFARQEIVASCLMLAWTYRFGSGPGRTTLSYQILDDPTQGDVKRLVAALGIEAPVARI